MHDQHVRLCHGVLHSRAYNWTLCRSSDSLFERYNTSPAPWSKNAAETMSGC